jgi:Tol biopolymer transport system component
MNVTLFRAALSLTLGCAAATTAAATSTCLCGSIVYSHQQFNADGTLRGTSLSMTTPGGGGNALTIDMDGVVDDSASWSPDGTRVAFERSSSASLATRLSDIYTLDTRTRRITKITYGPGNLVKPAWGPRNQIAYVSQYRTHDCLSLVDAKGVQHELFCPPNPAKLMRPVWSTDGNSIYVQAGYDMGGPDNFWRSLAYRIDAATGAPFVLDSRVFDGPQHLEFAPDGQHGIYSNAYPYAEEMTLVDFATRHPHPVGNGYAPRWSKNGLRIAYTGEVYELTNPVRYYEPLYVMDADGANARRVTATRLNNHAYTAADWSKDNVHLLANRRVYTDPALTVAEYSMRIVNVDTGGLRSLPSGVADSGAWFEH